MHGIIIFCIMITMFSFNGCQTASNLLHTAIIPQSYNYLKESPVAKCDFASALQEVQNSKSPFLKNAELGLLLFYQKNFNRSKTFFEKAISLYRKDESKPLLALSDYTVLDYMAEGYDKVFLHNYNALNYLLMGDLENAKVETKNSDFIQQKERERFYKEIRNYKSLKHIDRTLLNRYEKLFSRVDSSHNPYQNPFSFYISSLIFEEEGRLDDAAIDLRHALHYAPDSGFLHKRLEQYDKNNPISKRVELFFDIGRSPVKTQERVPVKVSKEKELRLYLPSFVLYLSQIDKIVLLDKKNNVIAVSHTLSDINAIKINAFRKMLPFMLDKIFKEVSKEMLGDTIARQNSLIGPVYNFLKVLYSQNNILSWTSLPQRIDVISFIPQINQEYMLEARDKNARVLDRIVFQVNCSEKLKNCYRHYVLKKDKFCK